MQPTCSQFNLVDQTMSSINFVEETKSVVNPGRFDRLNSKFGYPTMHFLKEIKPTVSLKSNYKQIVLKKKRITMRITSNLF